ncbi:UNVERIFIED_CONTAM: UDP-glucosyltransferase 29 [Sesamum angustifolium]|uniref:Glycosyltransferase n=1 Tax=Sesamum angustifolium TaxID=2727405 RepID=A0AAW2NYR1_9LAMI
MKKFQEFCFRISVLIFVYNNENDELEGAPRCYHVYRIVLENCDCKSAINVFVSGAEEFCVGIRKGSARIDPSSQFSPFFQFLHFRRSTELRFTFMEKQEAKFRILMFPWLAHGHIFPFLELAKRLSRRNFSIYLCSTAINLDFITTNTGKDVSDDPSIQLVELHIPPSSELPPELHTTKNLPSNLLTTLIQALQMSSSSFSNIMNSINPDLLIYDFFQPWAPKLASSKDAEEDFSFGNFKLSTDIILIESSRVVEGKYIDYLSSVCKKQIVPTGPLIADASGDHDEKFSEIMRFPIGEKSSIEEALPAGFLQTVKDRGIVVPGWAPQTRILAHPSTGGFVSHCGWGSIMESMYFGVPVIAMPMQSDQPINARLVVETGAGIEVERDGNGHYLAEGLAKAITKVIVEKAIL